MDKTFQISDNEFQKKNIEKIRNIFLVNNYSLTFINKYIDKILTFLKYKSSNIDNSNNDPTDTNYNNCISLPFVDKLSPNLSKILKKPVFIQFIKLTIN